MKHRAPLTYTLPSGRRVRLHGLPRRRWRDLYHVFMTASWPRLFGSFAAFFVLSNLLFAAAYSLQPDGITHLNPPGYWGRVFFSIETLATVGYGDMHPQKLYTHIVAAIEIFTGMMTLGVIAGMMFARFSRPTARFLFARHAVIGPVDGALTLVLRAANERQNIVMEAEARLRLIRDEISAEGVLLRRIHDLPLRRRDHPIFIFGWTLMHTIDAASPLAGASIESLTASNAYLLLTLSGIDETTHQTMIAQHEYPMSVLRWQHRFADILTPGEDGIDLFDYTRFHDVEPLA